MSNNRTGPRVKQCAHIALPPPPKDDNGEMIPCQPPPPIIVKSVPSGPFPMQHDPIQDIPSSGICLKPEFVSLLEPPAYKKKIESHGTLIKGQLGSIFFAPGFVRKCEEIPVGFSLIINTFRKPFHFEHAKTKYVLVDPFGEKWTSPETFNLWHECIEKGEAKEIDAKLYRLLLVRLPKYFALSTSLRKNKYSEQIHTIRMPGSGDEGDIEEEEAFPADDDENDSDFQPNKK